MRSYAVESFVRINGVFVALKDFHGKLPNNDYIEGKIELQVAGSQILSERHWDLLDQLWAYLIDGLMDVVYSDTALECFFPDQPLRLAIKASHPSQLEVCIGSENHSVDRATFVAAVSVGGATFFRRLVELVPSERAVWFDYVKRCQALVAGPRKSR